MKRLLYLTLIAVALGVVPARAGGFAEAPFDPWRPDQIAEAIDAFRRSCTGVLPGMAKEHDCLTMALKLTATKKAPATEDTQRAAIEAAIEHFGTSYRASFSAKGM